MSPEPMHHVSPCPSCGVSLKIHADRLGQKMQCPKCLTVFVSVNEPTSVASVGELRPQAAKRHPDRTLAELEANLSLLQGCVEHLRAERLIWAERVNVLARRHGELAEQYDRVVADYDVLVTEYEEAVKACGEAASSAPPGNPDRVIAGSSASRNSDTAP